ncbi:MAG: ISL3 family transposase [Cyanobacteria bacterium J06627_32]
MELLHCLLPSLHLLHLDSYDLAPREHHLTLNLTSTQAKARCPICGQPSHRVHSRYSRTLADLPCVSFSLTLIVRVCKFFCANPACPRRIFTERFPEVAASWARKTQRLVEHLQAIALTSGGQAGARLCVHLGLRCCGSTLLNLLSHLPLPPIKTPCILGVDDFALRRGQHYGTILVDIEAHRPIALLPDRTAETLETWLKAHPGVEILSRDRSKTYRSGMTAGAPAVMPVADRFHLLQNLEETLEKAFQGKSEAIKSVEIAQLQAAGISLSEIPKPKTSRQQRREEKRAQRLDNCKLKVLKGSCNNCYAAVTASLPAYSLSHAIEVCSTFTWQSSKVTESGSRKCAIASSITSSEGTSVCSAYCNTWL